MVGLPHPTRRKNEGTNLGRKHLEELSKRRRAFARKKRRRKRAERKSVRKKHKATRARSRLEELTFGTFFWHTVVCLNVTGRTKERIAQSKRARAGSLVLID